MKYLIFASVFFFLTIFCCDCFGSVKLDFVLGSLARGDSIPSKLNTDFNRFVCNYNININDHYFVYLRWCKHKKLADKQCFSRWSVACLFKKYMFALGDYDNNDQTNDMLKNVSMRDFNTFSENLVYVKKLMETMNAKSSTESTRGYFGVSKFMHLSRDSFKNIYLNSLKTRNHSLNMTSNTASSIRVRRSVLPTRVDWRNNLAVTAVKNQGSCGACWSFAVTEVMESQTKIMSQELLTLSVQQMTDCALCFWCAGCAGGEICDTAHFYSKASTKGLGLQSDYPYTGTNETCRSVTSSVKADKVTCSNLVNNEEEIIQVLAEHGTVAVAVDANLWQFYLSGIIMHNCENQLNHAVQIVGYDTAGEVPYYIVRNSWGLDFGEQGYLRIRYGANVCGISNEVVYLNTVLNYT